MPLRDSKKLKLSKITIQSDQVVLCPHPNIGGIYRCYALILSASPQPTPTSLFYLDTCTTSIPHQYAVFSNLTLLYYSQTKPIQIKIVMKDDNVLDWNKIKYQLSIELLQYVQQLKIDIHRVYPKQLLELLNQHLSHTAIYDFNLRIYEKSHTQLSFHTLALLLGCSRNQLIYRQSQIDHTYQAKCSDLTQKCFALNFQKFSTKIFWEI